MVTYVVPSGGWSGDRLTLLLWHTLLADRFHALRCLSKVRCHTARCIQHKGQIHLRYLVWFKSVVLRSILATVSNGRCIIGVWLPLLDETSCQPTAMEARVSKARERRGMRASQGTLLPLVHFPQPRPPSQHQRQGIIHLDVGLQPAPDLARRALNSCGGRASVACWL